MPLLSGTTIRALKQGTNMTLSFDGSQTITVNGPTIPSYDNTAVSWSTGATSTDIHTLNTGQVQLDIKTNTNATSMSVYGNQGTVGNTIEGKVKFWKDVDILGTLTVAGANVMQSLANASNIIGGYATSFTTTNLKTDTIDTNTTSTLNINKPVSITGDLSVTGFYARKPWVGFTMSAAGVLSAPIGYNTSGVTVAHPSASDAYTITMPSHPAGTAYHVYVSVFTNSNSTDVVAVPTVKISSATQFIVWLRSALGTGTARTEGVFYFHTVP
jgi:hypothetical protein